MTSLDVADAPLDVADAALLEALSLLFAADPKRAASLVRSAQSKSSRFENWVSEPLESAAERFVETNLNGWVTTERAVLRIGDDNVAFGTLGARTGALGTFRTYAAPDGSAVTALASFSDGTSGHAGIVHGGLTAMIFDQTAGWANGAHVLAKMANGPLSADSFVEGGGDVSSHDLVGFTASLTVNYRRKVAVGTTVAVSCRVDKTDGRKRFITGEMTDVESGLVLCEATALYVLPRPSPAVEPPAPAVQVRAPDETECAEAPSPAANA